MAASGSQNKHKANQSRKKSGYYQKQYYRTATNKIRRLRKRTAFDPTAAAAIDKLKVVTVKS